MPAVTEFSYYDDPTAKTGGSTASITYTATPVVAFQGVTLAHADVPAFRSTLALVANQDPADGSTEAEVQARRADGSVIATIKATFTGTPLAVATVTPGGVTAISRAKALDLLAGLTTYLP